MLPLFDDLDWPLKASRVLSAIVEFLILCCDVEVHSLDYATAYCNVSIVPMAVCFNSEKFLPPPSVHTVDIFFSFSIFYNSAPNYWCSEPVHGL